MEIYDYRFGHLWNANANIIAYRGCNAKFVREILFRDIL